MTMSTVLLPEAKKSKIEPCANWKAVTEAFDSFPAPKIDFGSEGEMLRTTWVFRGHKSATYELKPSVERAVHGKSVSWAAVESMVLEEFQSKARMHLDPSDLPPSQHKLSWLALMQHYGVPTRLLDFTFSPFVALYFAVRNRTDPIDSPPVVVWAIDAEALLEAARILSRNADREEEEYVAARQGGIPIRQRISLDPRFFATDLDVLVGANQQWARLLSNPLAPSGIHRDLFNKNGFVVFASPPAQNRRLSSQQGAFLLSGAEDLTFKESLFTMMKDWGDNWFRLFQVPNESLAEAEQKLFQMNIHDLSLFPDMEGLAGFIRQKARLHWVPT
jgi:hypothetical protein